MNDDEFRTLKPGDRVIVYDFNEKKEKEGVIEALGGYCVLAKTETENSVYYKEEIMKKLSIILIALFMASCAKTYNCECNTLNHNSGTVSSSSYGINDKKDAAISKCNGGDEYSTSYSRDCNITNQ